MKKILLSLFTVALSVATVFAQAPEKMNYQGVARDNSGNVLPNQAVGLQVKLHSATPGGTVVYSETHATSTNAFGLFNVQIGTGSNVTGTFNSIGWGANAFYVEVLMDATGGTSYVSMGTQQLVSVPYALNARSAATTAAVSGTTNYVSKFTSANAIGNSSIFDNGLVGIGTLNPGAQLHLYGTADPLLVLDGPSGSQSPLSFSVDGSSKWALYVPNGLTDFSLWNWQTNNDAIIFNGTNNDVLIAPNAGNVGIGTSAPAQLFQVNGITSMGDNIGSSVIYGNLSGQSVALSVIGNTTGSPAGTSRTRTLIGGKSFSQPGITEGVDYYYGVWGHAYPAGEGYGVVASYGANPNTATNTAYLGSANYAGYFNGNVGIGYSYPSSPLHVSAYTTPYAGYFTNSYGTSGATHVIHATANHTGNVDAAGVYGENIVASFYGYGVRGFAGFMGGDFEATVSGAGTRYGVYGVAGGTTGSTYGVYGIASGGATNWGGYFAGNVYTSGTYTPSDANLKLNIKEYNNATAMISNIPVKSYTYKTDGIYGKMNLPEGNQIGIMAQDLQAVYPELVKDASFEDVQSYQKGLVKKEDMESINYKAVNYTGLVPVMIKAMQEQNLVIQKLQERIKALEAK